MSNSPQLKKRKIEQHSVALQRWNILKQVLIDGKSLVLASENAASVRRFKSFHLLEAEREDTKLCTGDNTDWYMYTAPLFPTFKMYICHLSDHVKPESLKGFNNTGNVCVWPAEEVLTYYCLSNKEKFSGKSVIELGGGMTCLAGVALSIVSDVAYMELTDGNEDSVTNLDKIISRNVNQFADTVVSSRVLRWGNGELNQDLIGQFDFVLCADCLFFESGREDLVKTIHSLLKPQGEAILFAPQRGDSFNAFVNIAKAYFQCQVSENYDDTVWNLHCRMIEKGLEHYDADIHYPWFVSLIKVGSTREDSSDR